MKRYEGKDIKVTTYKRGGYYILRIQSYATHICSTRKRGEYAVDAWWGEAYEKKFEQKEQANNYFKAIRMNHVDMALVADEPNKYISYDGTVKEF